MYEAYRCEPRKHEVWSPREFSIVEAVSETTGMKSPPKGEFGPCVSASDPGHHSRTGRSVHYVWHRRSHACHGVHASPYLTGGVAVSQGYLSGAALHCKRVRIHLRCQAGADDKA